MTSSTFSWVDSRTFTPPLSTRETVPTPTPAAAATSAMVGRSGVRTGTSLNGIAYFGNDSNLDWLIVTPRRDRVKRAVPGAVCNPPSRRQDEQVRGRGHSAPARRGYSAPAGRRRSGHRPETLRRPATAPGVRVHTINVRAAMIRAARAHRAQCPGLERAGR